MAKIQFKESQKILMLLVTGNGLTRLLLFDDKYASKCVLPRMLPGTYKTKTPSFIE